MQDNSNTHLIIIFLLFITIINLFILDLKVFNPMSNIQISDISTVNISPSPDQVTTQNSSNSLSANSQPITNNLSCPINCLSIIQNATKSSNIGTANAPKISNQVNSPSQSHETYIPLGTGTTSKTDWEDITSTDTTLDPSNYVSIKEVYFIASLKNPTQNGSVVAELYNVTDKHPVWNSQVVMNGPVTQTITSPIITLDNGNKLYRVKLKSTLGYQVSLDNAKIKIISN